MRSSSSTASVTFEISSGDTSTLYCSSRNAWISRTVMPRASYAMMHSSNPLSRRSALLWAADHAQYALLTRPVLDCLTISDEMASRFIDIQLLYKEAEAALRRQPGDHAAVLSDHIAIRYERLNIFAQTGVDHERAEVILARTRRRGDKYETACVLWVLGDRYNGHHDYDTQLARVEESLALWREIGDDFYIASLLIVLSGHYFESDLARVAGLQQEANHIFAKLGVASRAQAIVAAQKLHLA